MLKYIALAFLLLPLTSPEPSGDNGNNNQRNNDPQLAASPLNSPDIQTKQSGGQAASGQAKETDSQTEIAKAAQVTNDRIATATVVIAVFSVFSFLAACGYIVAALLQWKEIKKQAKLTGEHLTKLERPFVFRDEINWQFNWDMGERRGKYWYSIRPGLRNSGNTPTVNLFLKVDRILRDSPLPKDFDFDKAFTVEGNPTIIGPKAHIVSSFITVLDDDLLAVQNKTKYLYIFGKAEYRDLFEGTPIHTTRFCNQVIAVLGNPLDPRDTRDHTRTTVEIVFSIYPEYNSAD